MIYLWGAKPEQVPLSVQWFKENIKSDWEFVGEVAELSTDLERYRIDHILGPLRKHTMDDPSLQFLGDEIMYFVSDEICLALLSQAFLRYNYIEMTMLCILLRRDSDTKVPWKDHFLPLLFFHLKVRHF